MTLGEQALAHADALYNLARYLTGNPADAQDLVQETYSRALGAGSFVPGPSVKAWLFRILRNTFIDGYRRQKRNPAQQTLDDVEPPAAEPNLRDDVDLSRLRALVASEIEAAMMSLPDEARMTVLLDLEGFTETEAAEVLGCAVGTVKSRLGRARAALRAKLRDYARER
jgi:RNA polymerase sigma-70 factor (ECF subfamily)